LVGDKWERTQQDSLDPTENRSGCADPEGKAEDREQGESGTAPEHPKSEAEVLQHIGL
jgi:hypothetical protein